jgi:large subunit ribosomal protein L3
MSGLLGKKIGMTHIFTPDGTRIGVTAIEAGPCPVLAIKEKNLKLGFDLAKEASLKKPLAGCFKKLNVAARKFIREVPRDSTGEYSIGQELRADMFKEGDFLDICGVSIGKGFQGGMKRWHWQGGPKSRGSTSHRRVGSIGSSTTPGRVWKGHHMPGHMGMSRVTVQNLKVVKVDLENNMLLVKGAVAGPKNGYLIIRKAKKK